MRRINRFIRKVPFYYAFAVLSIVVGGYFLLYWLIYHQLLAGKPDIIFVDSNLYEVFQSYARYVFALLVVAPLLETLVFQVALCRLLRLMKWLRERECYIVLIGGILFGLYHYYSLVHIIVSAIGGALFMYVYLVRRRKGGYWMVVLLHALWNGIGLLFEHFGLI